MTGFASFDDFLALSRVVGLALSGDGMRLIATVAELDDDGAKLVNALWEIDRAGAAPARRLTRSDRGESSPAFRRDGSVLFVSARDGADGDPAALWSLPPLGEAHRVLTRPGGISGVVTARDADTLVVSSATMPGALDVEADEARVTARKELEVAAVLHTASPVRHWDHDLGPAQPRLLATTDFGQPRDLTPQPGRALDDASFTLTPDGSIVVTSWNVADEPGLPHANLVAIDTATGALRVLAEDAEVSFTEPAVSPDGTQVVAVRSTEGDYDDIPTNSLWLTDLAGGAGRELLVDPDVWPGSPVFSADGSAIFFLADELGERPVFRLDLGSQQVTRVTASGHHTHLQVAPDGQTLYALRDTIGTPPRPVRIDAGGSDTESVELPAPGATAATGPVEQLTVTVAGGTTVHARLVLPGGASADSPAPLLLWMHGGPLGSWNSWSWRWNPWLMAGRGYAVVLPDPALSTGYGAAMVQRGWGQWGGTPFTDLMSVTDAVIARPDIDETRTAAMGGSYGGYLANWVAGHTDRFRAIVTHAGLWALEQFQGTTDTPGYWVKEWGLPAVQPERYTQWSPHHFVAQISTPMLVVHGDKDYRVPVGEALRLWWDLQRTGVESSYLYFPDEGHWILKPGNARVWYDTVWAWLAQHVLDEPWVQPDLL